MKFRFAVLIAVIIGLVVLFCIIGRRVFDHRDNALDSRTERRTVSFAETESVPMPEGNSEAGIKPAGEMKHETAATEENRSPYAVPVVTREEAEKLNAEALFLQEVERTVVEGVVVERSILPDPAELNYPNCRFTIHFNGNTIKSGAPCPKEIVIILEGIKNHTLLKTDEIKEGDKIECAIIPYDVLPEEMQSTQQADDLNLFMLDSFYALNARTINDFTDNAMMPVSGIFFSDGNRDYVSIFDRHINPPVSNEAEEAQTAAIEADLKRINAELEGCDESRISALNEEFKETWAKETEKDPQGYNRVGNHVWRNMDNSFWCLPVDYTFVPPAAQRELSPDIVGFFKDIKDALNSNGVQLIVSLVPHMYSISSRVINKVFRTIPDIQTAAVARQLLENGIETVYASNEILENYNRYPFAYFFPDDGHPSDTVQDILSDMLEKRISRFYSDIGPANLDSSLFEIKQMPHVFGDQEKFQWPADCDIGQMNPGTSYQNREVYYAGKKMRPDSQSPFLVIGNSFIRTPMNSPCSLPTLLSYKSNYSIDYLLVYNQGPFVQFPRNLVMNPERYLKDKKVLIFQVGLTHLFDMTQQLTNIKQIDETLSLLSNKKILLSYIPKEMTKERPQISREVSNHLENPVYFLIKTADEEIEIARLSPSDVDTGKSIVCLIPSIAFKSSPKITLSVNGIKHIIPSFYNSRPDYVPLSFSLPPGTSEIRISASVESRGEVFFALSNIQIYQ